MIGGRVLGTTALLQFASPNSVYAQAVVWVALEESLVLTVPATSLAEAWALADPAHHDALDVLLCLPITVVEPLDSTQARPIGELLAAAGSRDISTGHAARCAARRGWPVVTATPEPLRHINPALDIEELP